MYIYIFFYKDIYWFYKYFEINIFASQKNIEFIVQVSCTVYCRGIFLYLEGEIIYIYICIYIYII